MAQGDFLGLFLVFGLWHSRRTMTILADFGYDTRARFRGGVPTETQNVRRPVSAAPWRPGEYEKTRRPKSYRRDVESTRGFAAGYPPGYLWVLWRSRREGRRGRSGKGCWTAWLGISVWLLASGSACFM